MAEVKVTVNRSLDFQIAALVSPQIEQVADRIRDAARKAAPGVKTWISTGDGRVRDQHVIAHATHPPIPENLRFQLPSYQWDMEHYGVGAVTYMLHPKDHSSGLGEDAAAIHHCRCRPLMQVDPAGLSRKIQRSHVAVVGKSIRTKVSITAPWAIEAELGDVYPGVVPPAQAARFMFKGAVSSRG